MKIGAKSNPVKLKQVIQFKLNKEFAGLSDSERNNFIISRVAKDPLLSMFLLKAIR
jgi:hypothetical protein